MKEAGKRTAGKPSRARPKLVRPSEEMKAWSAMLAGELASWPGVRRRAMFGFHAFYRGGRIFAVLPGTRTLETPNAIAVKLKAGRARGLRKAQGWDEDPEPRAGARWRSFEVLCGQDLRAALGWLEQAHRAAGASR